MAKAQKTTKEKVIKSPKGPKPDFTPKVKTVKSSETPRLPIVYHGEGTFVIRERGAECSWNEASRQLALDAAQDFVSSYSVAARGPLFEFSEKISLSNTWKEINDEEYRYFGGVITKGSHMKRQRFWKFVSYIGAGRIPRDLHLRVNDDDATFTGEGRAVAMEYLTGRVSEMANILISDGASPDIMVRWDCVIAINILCDDWDVIPEAAPPDYSKQTHKGYKSLAEWATRPTTPPKR